MCTGESLRNICPLLLLLAPFRFHVLWIRVNFSTAITSSTEVQRQMLKYPKPLWLLYELSLPLDRNFDNVSFLIGTEINDFIDLEVPIDSIVKGITDLMNKGMDSSRQGHVFDAALILIEASTLCTP